LLDKFAKEHNVEVTMDTYDSNESMLASLKAGKLGSYDVAVPGDYMVVTSQASGLTLVLIQAVKALFHISGDQPAFL